MSNTMQTIYQVVFVILSFLFTVNGYGQNALELLNQTRGNAKLKGEILENLGNKPVEFATISVFLAKSNKVINGTITDFDGKFEIEQLPSAPLRIEVSYLGYETKVFEDILIADGQTKDLGEISIEESSVLLNEVQITGERSMFEEKVDRMVYNAGQDLLSKGTDAADVLRKVPLLQVDLDGNVSIRGSSNITVLINNKPSTIIAANVADALKMLPSDMIDKVEVITSPSAKYDAEGSGGIINIITKKNNLKGHYLNVNTGIGLRGSNLGLNGSYRSGKFGMTLGGFGRAFYNDAESDMTQMTTFNGITNNTIQESKASDNGIFGRYNLGFDYDLDKTQFLSAGIRYGVRDFSSDQVLLTQFSRNNDLLSQTTRNISSDRGSGNWDFNMDYLKQFAPGHELSISTLYSITNENSNFISDLLTENGSFDNSLKNIDDNSNREVTVQVDYVLPMGQKQIFEVGAKAIFRRVNSDFAYQSATTPGDFSFDPNRPSGFLDYNQDVSAGYAAYTLSLPSDYTVKAGLRYEGTNIGAIQNNETINIPSYGNLVPSVNLSKKLSMMTTLKFGFNQRIQRPWLRQLNPNVNLQNQQSIQVGNPNLRPELTNNFELGLSTMIKKTFVNTSLFYRKSSNAINSVRYPNENGAIVSTFENIGIEESYGINVFLNANISEKFSLNGGFDLGINDLQGQVTNALGVSETATNNGLNYGGRLMGQYKMDNGWSLQAFSFMRGRRVELQGETGGYGMYSLGVNKDFKNKKGSVGLAVENFGSRGWSINSQINSPNFNQVNNRLLLNRSIRVNFSYQIGSMDANKRSKTKSVNNSDLMGGGDGGDIGGAAPAAGGGGGRPSGGRPAAAPAPAKENASMDGVDITGTWKGMSETPMGSREVTYEFVMTDTVLSGKMVSQRGNIELTNGTIEKGALSFSLSMMGREMKMTGTVLSATEIEINTGMGSMKLTKQ